MVYFLMTFLLHFIKDSSSSIWMALPSFAIEMVIGGIGGLITGYGMLWLINKNQSDTKGALSCVDFGYDIFTVWYCE